MSDSKNREGAAGMPLSEIPKILGSQDKSESAFNREDAEIFLRAHLDPVIERFFSQGMTEREVYKRILQEILVDNDPLTMDFGLKWTDFIKKEIVTIYNSLKK